MRSTLLKSSVSLALIVASLFTWSAPAMALRQEQKAQTGLEELKRSLTSGNPDDLGPALTHLAGAVVAPRPPAAGQRPVVRPPSAEAAGLEEQAAPLSVLVVGEGAIADRIAAVAQGAAGSVPGSTRLPRVEVLVVSTDEEARKAISRNKPDLIFTMGESHRVFASNVLREAHKMNFPQPEVFLVDFRLRDEREQRDRLKLFDNRFIPINLQSDPELKNAFQAIKLRVAAHLAARLNAGLEEKARIGRVVEAWIGLYEKGKGPGTLGGMEGVSQKRVETLLLAHRAEALELLDLWLDNPKEMTRLRQQYPRADSAITDLVRMIAINNSHHVPTLVAALLVLKHHKSQDLNAQHDNNDLKDSVETILQGAISDTDFRRKQGMADPEFLAGLEERRPKITGFKVAPPRAGTVVLSFDPAAAVAIKQLQAERVGILLQVVPFVNQVEPLKRMGVAPSEMLGILWPGVSEEDWVKVGVHSMAAAQIGAPGWEEEVIAAVSRALNFNRAMIVIRNAANFQAGLEELGYAGVTLEEAEQAYSNAEATLREMM